MSLKIYGSSHSRALRVLWMLEELGLPYAHDPIGFDTCGKDAAYLAINPAGTIPCIDDAGFVLAESLAINLYLAEKHPTLGALTLPEKALATQWSLFAATALEPEYLRWALNTAWLPEGLRKPEEAQAALHALHRPLARLNLALEGQDWLLGAHFSVADLNVASVLNLLNGHLNADFPALASWLARCLARPACEKAAQQP